MTQRHNKVQQTKPTSFSCESNPFFLRAGFDLIELSGYRSTLDLVSAAARRRKPAKLLLIGTYRPTDVIISQSPLKALKQDLLVHKLCREITLERLEESSVAEYLSGEFAECSFDTAGLANLVHRHSG